MPLMLWITGKLQSCMEEPGQLNVKHNTLALSQINRVILGFPRQQEIMGVDNS